MVAPKRRDPLKNITRNAFSATFYLFWYGDKLAIGITRACDPPGVVGASSILLVGFGLNAEFDVLLY